MWSELIYSKYERRWYCCLFYSNHILYTIIIFYRKDVQQYETELFYAWRNKKIANELDEVMYRYVLW